jgi:anti-anti-sigma factor
MEVQARRERNAMVILVKGRMDAVTAPEFEKSLSDLISKGEKTFLLNLNGLEYISSAGLRAILATAKKLKEQNGKIILTGLKGSVGEVFKISGFDSIFKIFDSEENALKEI